MRAEYDSIRHLPLNEQKGLRSKARRYGITPQIWFQIIAEQDGKCAICGKVPKRMVLDHDHETGQVRGMLCDRCNSFLGWYENSYIRERVVEYLEQSHGEEES